MIVVDTSVLINLFKGNRTKSVERFIRLENQGAPMVIPAICCQEILQGVKNKKEWDILFLYLQTQELLFPPTALSTYSSAANIYFTLRRNGLTVRSTIDCLIAQQVMELKEGCLLHEDKDFTMISHYYPLKIWAETAPSPRRPPESPR